MHYVIGDIHNDNIKLNALLKRISFGREDHVCILGDLFDRGEAEADPVGVYFTVLGLGERCTVIKGNHDEWLAQHIRGYVSLSEKKQRKYAPYGYNSFDLMRERLTLVDLCELSDFLCGLPLQVTLKLDRNYLFAHAMTSLPDKKEDDEYYLQGGRDINGFVKKGTEGWISFCGHANTSYFQSFPGRYLDEDGTSIWCNEAGNVYMMDCSCGLAGGKLGCMCLETGERFYV